MTDEMSESQNGPSASHRRNRGAAPIIEGQVLEEKTVPEAEIADSKKPDEATQDSAPQTAQTLRERLAAKLQNPTPIVFIAAFVGGMGMLALFGFLMFTMSRTVRDAHNPRVQNETPLPVVTQSATENGPALGDPIKSLETRLTNLETSTQQKLRAQETSLQDLAGRLSQPAPTDAATNETAQTLAALGGRIQAIEESLATLKSAAPDKGTPTSQGREVAQLVIASTIMRAIENGVVFTQEVDALSALGSEPKPLAILQTNAAQTPSFRALTSNFVSLSRQFVKAQTAPQDIENETIIEKLANGARRLVKVQPIDGSAPAGSIAANIAQALSNNELSKALALRETLPEADRRLTSDWAKSVQIRLDVETAAKQLYANALHDVAQHNQASSRANP